MSAPPPIRVCLLEPDAIRRGALARALQADGTIVVVAEAAAPAAGTRAVARTRPDVVVLGLGLLGAAGPGVVAVVDALMAERAVAILVVTPPDQPDGGTLAVEALAAGAVDVLPFPAEEDVDAGSRLRRRVGVLARLPMITRRAAPPARPPSAPRGGHRPVVAIASSTGGPGALRELLAGLGRIAAPVLLVQHIHNDFSASFAAWLQGEVGLPVTLATAGAAPTAGCVHVAPGDVHLRLAPGPRLSLDPEPELLSRPSGDELLRSVAEVAGPAAIGVVLTGMGDDGARGLLAIRHAGGTTFAQDGASAVVDGMPRAARELGAVGRSLPPRALGEAVADVVAGLAGSAR